MCVSLICVQVRGRAEMKETAGNGAEDAAQPIEPAGVCNKPADEVSVIRDISAFKRGCQIHPGVAPHFTPEIASGDAGQPKIEYCNLIGKSC